MFGARVVAVANSQSADAADAVLNQGFAVARTSERPRRWWQRLFAGATENDQAAMVTGSAPAAVEPVELRPRPVIRLDPARGTID